MRAMTGRAVSAAIHQRLREALEQGQPLTYRQLAEQAGCTIRSVRNYLDRSQEIFGFPIQRSRDSAHRVVVRAVGVTPRAARRPKDKTKTNPFDGALTRALFQQDAHDPTPVIVALPGLPSYGSHHAAIAKQWAEAAGSKPAAFRLLTGPHRNPIVLWPVAVVVHGVDGIVLVGVEPGAQSPHHVKTIPLHDVPDEPETMLPTDADPFAFERGDVAVGLALGLPFTARSHDLVDPSVDVHVRFSPELAPRLADRRWHPDQQVAIRKSGELDVRFGPVALGAAASWVASFGAGVRVMGDKKLKKAVKKSSFLP